MLIRVALICIAVLIAAPSRAFAYTDPGSGTLILQILLAASFGVMFYFRRIIGWVRGFKPGKKSSSETLSAETEKENSLI